MRAGIKVRLARLEAKSAGLREGPTVVFGDDSAHVAPDGPPVFRVQFVTATPPQDHGGMRGGAAGATRRG
jgi:hypothetical protein